MKAVLLGGEGQLFGNWTALSLGCLELFIFAGRVCILVRVALHMSAFVCLWQNINHFLLRLLGTRSSPGNLRALQYRNVCALYSCLH